MFNSYVKLPEGTYLFSFPVLVLRTAGGLFTSLQCKIGKFGWFSQIVFLRNYPSSMMTNSWLWSRRVRCQDSKVAEFVDDVVLVLMDAY